MHMWSDLFSGGVTHVRQLLREVTRREKMNSRLMESIGNNECEKFVSVRDLLDHPLAYGPRRAVKSIPYGLEREGLLYRSDGLR